MRKEGCSVSYLITDHFHLWEQGSGNYHMGYTGFNFVRGAESDGLYTEPGDFPCPEKERLLKTERHWRNVHKIRRSESDWFSAQVFSRAADWIRRNHEHEDFYLHLDCFDPHEPWDPPEDLVKMFDPRGYDVDGWTSGPPYDKWRETLSESHFLSLRARYAAKVVLVDRWLGRLMEAMDELDLWKNTLLALTTDHGTFNGDHGRIGKLQTHLFDSISHVPMIAACPDGPRGERRDQLVQLVDLYPTVLSAVGRPVPEERHGVNLLPAIADSTAKTRDYALAGQFGTSVTFTDGRWVLHQSPVEGNKPLYWHGYCLAKFLPYKLGPFEDGRREVMDHSSWPTPTWLSDRDSDPTELVNLADKEPRKLREMQQALSATLQQLGAPDEQFERLALARD